MSDAFPIYSFVIPVFNECANLNVLFDRLQRVMDDLDGVSEIIIVDDGSSDGSAKVVADHCGKDERIREEPRNCVRR